MREIILKKRYPHSREEDITDAFMRGYQQGRVDAVDKMVKSLDSMAEDMEHFGDFEKAKGVTSAAWLISYMRDFADRKDESQKRCHRRPDTPCYLLPRDDTCHKCKQYYEDEPQDEIKGGEQTEKGVGCSKCDLRYWCPDRSTPVAVHCNNYDKVTDPSFK